MSLTEDISKFLLRSSPGAIMTFLKFRQDVKITKVSDKLLVAAAWKQEGSRDDQMPILEKHLGESTQAYLSPLVDNLKLSTMSTIISNYSDTKILPGMEVLIKEILHTKMYDYLQHEGITSLAQQKSIDIDTKARKLVTYSIKSKYADRFFITLTLEWKDGAYLINSRFLDLGYTGAENPLTEKSSKAIKKIMYEMSTHSRLDLSLLDGILPILRYQDPVLDCFTLNLKTYLSS